MYMYTNISKTKKRKQTHSSDTHPLDLAVPISNPSSSPPRHTATEAGSEIPYPQISPSSSFVIYPVRLLSSREILIRVYVSGIECLAVGRNQ